MPESAVTVQIPASTSNCGPGFDTLSVALSLYNFVRITPRGDDAIAPVGEALPGTQDMVETAAMSFAQTAAVDICGFDYEIWGEVPVARGLGSSSTVRAGVIAALNRLTGEPLDAEEMIRLTSRLDNAADNACAAFSGGFCVARIRPDDFRYERHVRFGLPDRLRFVAVAPAYEVLTEDSRRVLPDKLPFKDVVRSANSLAFLVGAFVAGDFSQLRNAVDDYIHEPYRESLNPFAREAIEAGEHAGAHAGWLSGSGSTVVCVCEADLASAVAAAMESAYGAHGIESRAYRLSPENNGLRFV